MVPAPTFLAGGVLYPPSIFWSLPFIPNVLYANVFTMLPSLPSSATTTITTVFNSFAIETALHLSLIHI